MMKPSIIDAYQQTLQLSQTVTATGAGSLFALAFAPTDANFVLSVTAASGTTPTLDVYLQWSPDGGTTWYDFIHHTQITGVKADAARWSSKLDGLASASAVLTGNGVLASGVIIPGPIVTSAIRVIWIVGGTTPSFTFSVIGVLARYAS